MQATEELDVSALCSTLQAALESQLGGHFIVELKKLKVTERRSAAGNQHGFELALTVEDRSHHERLRGGTPYQVDELVNKILAK